MKLNNPQNILGSRILLVTQPTIKKESTWKGKAVKALVGITLIASLFANIYYYTRLSFVLEMYRRCPPTYCSFSTCYKMYKDQTLENIKNGAALTLPNIDFANICK